MKSTKYYIILISLVSFKLYGAVLPVNPGELLYGIVTRIGDELDSVYETTTNIDSKVDSLAIAVNNVSIQDALIYDTVTVIDSKVDVVDTKVNGISAQDALIYNTALQINSQVSSLIETSTAMDELIYKTVTEIDTKIDTVLVDIDNVSAQNVMLYNLESVIDSKVDEIRSFPDFVQTATLYTSQGINSKTSRYFYTVFTGNSNSFFEGYVASLKNNNVNNRVIRISAIGITTTALTIGSASLSSLVVRKNATLSGASFTDIDPINSDMQSDTSATWTASTGTLVYGIDLWSSGGGTLKPIGIKFKNISKETYSIILAPGEVLTFNMIPDGNINYRLHVLWEEIINY